MSYRPTALGSQVQLEPDRARATILEKFREAGANVTATAELLGISERQLHRYIEALKLGGTIDSTRERARLEGWLKSARWAGKKP